MLYDGYMWFNNYRSHSYGCPRYVTMIVDIENDVGAWHITEDVDEGIFICAIVLR